MPEYRYKYAILNHTGGSGGAIDFKSKFSRAARHGVAQAAAWDCYRSSRRNPDEWPITFKIWTADDGFVGRFKVHCYVDPRFEVTDA